MKTLLLNALLIMSMCNLYAQTPTPYHSGFDNSTQQAGWQKFRQGTLHLFEWEFGPGIGAASAPYCAWHNYPAGGVPVPVVDWIVSPVFNFTGGGKIDSLKVSVYTPSGIAGANDHFGIYLLNGSADPSVATVTLLSDLTSLATTSQVYKDILNISIPATGGNCYIGFKYSCQNTSFIARFDDIKITAAAGCVAPSALNAVPTESSVNITWNAVPGVAGYNYVLDNQPNDPTVIGNTTSGITFTTTGLSHSTTYYFHIRSACGGNFNSGWISQAFTTSVPGIPCEQPGGIQITEITDVSAKLSWATISGSKGYEYIVSDNPAFPTNSGNTANATYANVENLNPGTFYNAYLRTRCEGSAGFIFSPWIGRQFFTEFPSVVNTLPTAEKLTVYPNPASDKLILSGTEEGGQLTITGLSGQVIETLKTNSRTTGIDVHQYPAGMYILHYISGNIRFHTRIDRK